MSGPSGRKPADLPSNGLDARVLVLGTGNILWADEGFGVRCAEAFADAFEFGPEIEVLDGGTQGLYLVDLFRDFDRVILFDAIDFGDGPGTMRIVRDEEIPAFLTAKQMSLHQVGLQDVIACARLLGGCAEHMTLIGVQPVEMDDYGGSLRPAMRARIPHAVAAAADELRSWGVRLTPRQSDRSRTPVVVPALALERYEAERPEAGDACRHGDARVLRRSGML